MVYSWEILHFHLIQHASATPKHSMQWHIYAYLCISWALKVLSRGSSMAQTFPLPNSSSLEHDQLPPVPLPCLLLLASALRSPTLERTPWRWAARQGTRLRRKWRSCSRTPRGGPARARRDSAPGGEQKNSATRWIIHSGGVCSFFVANIGLCKFRG